MTQLFLPGLEPVLPAPRSLALQVANPLAAYPHVSGDIRSSLAKAIGRSGEFLTDSVATRFGVRSIAAGEDEAFDRYLVLADRWKRTQIKTLTAPNASGSFVFSFARGYSRSNQGRRHYEDGDYDIKACVILPLNAVYFTSAKGHSVSISHALLRQILQTPQESLFAAMEGASPVIDGL